MDMPVKYYNSITLRIAAKESFLHISWLVALIGIPIVFFRDGLNFQEKSLLFICFLIFFWLLYLLLCLIFHRLSLRNETTLKLYLSKDDVKKGIEVGTHLEGW